MFSRLVEVLFIAQANIFLAQGFALLLPTSYIGASRSLTVLRVEPIAEGPKGKPRGSSQRLSPGARPRPSRTPRSRPEAPKYPVATKRAPHQHDHTKADPRPFIDAIQEVRTQDPNLEAPLFQSDHFKTIEGSTIEHNHIETRSLDQLFLSCNGKFCDLFSSCDEFRNGIRNAIRLDIFDSTPAYAGMSEKARKMLLLPDSSLQGSWKCKGRHGLKQGEIRMLTLTKVLKRHLGDSAPTGDEFMDTIGQLCGSNPQTLWIDIVGITDRKISHSWRQDTGRSLNNDSKTVLLGFPMENNYVGGGVFSHMVKLKNEQWACDGHPPNEPILFDHDIDKNYIVRPQFAKGQEILIYRDVDVLHSSPDVAYRSSVMQFT